MRRPIELAKVLELLCLYKVSYYGIRLKVYNFLAGEINYKSCFTSVEFFDASRRDVIEDATNDVL
jgi:hypothetical protein